MDKSNEKRIDGHLLRRAALNRISESRVMQHAIRRPNLIMPGPGGSILPNMERARHDMELRAFDSPTLADPWVWPVAVAWQKLSGLDARRSRFWHEHGYRNAVQHGLDITLKRETIDGRDYILVTDGRRWTHKQEIPKKP